MGYTNYWTKSNKKRISPAIIGQVNKILATYEQQSGEKLVKGFFHKDEAPTVSPTLIHFNVNNEDSDTMKLLSSAGIKYTEKMQAR